MVEKDVRGCCSRGKATVYLMNRVPVPPFRFLVLSEMLNKHIQYWVRYRVVSMSQTCPYAVVSVSTLVNTSLLIGHSMQGERGQQLIPMLKPAFNDVGTAGDSKQGNRHRRTNIRWDTHKLNTIIYPPKLDICTRRPGGRQGANTQGKPVFLVPLVLLMYTGRNPARREP